MASGREEKARRERKQQRAEKFWGAFRFTENGKPKSGFGVYTFSLSIAFAAVYALCYEAAIRLLTGPTAALPVWLGNLLTALAAAAMGTLLCCFPHRFFTDKRLVLGGYLWLDAYAAAILVIMLILLASQGGAGAFLIFFGWFCLLPAAVGTAAAVLLWRRDRPAPQAQQPEEPEWKKYVDRR